MKSDRPDVSAVTGQTILSPAEAIARLELWLTRKMTVEQRTKLESMLDVYRARQASELADRQMVYQEDEPARGV